MGFWKRIFGLEAKMTPLELFREVYGGYESGTGISINPANALNITTVMACCKVLAEGVSQVPFRVYQDLDSGRRLAKDHPLYKVYGGSQVHGRQVLNFVKH